MDYVTCSVGLFLFLNYIATQPGENFIQSQLFVCLQQKKSVILYKIRLSCPTHYLFSLYVEYCWTTVWYNALPLSCCCTASPSAKVLFKDYPAHYAWIKMQYSGSWILGIWEENFVADAYICLSLSLSSCTLPILDAKGSCFLLVSDHKEQELTTAWQRACFFDQEKYDGHRQPYAPHAIDLLSSKEFNSNGTNAT